MAPAEVEQRGPVGSVSVPAGGRHRAQDAHKDKRDDEDAVDRHEHVSSALLMIDAVAAPTSVALQPYVGFSELLPPVHQTPLIVVVANVVRIVAVEGPVLGERLHQAYRNAYGGQRVGKEIARLLNRAISLAERGRQIVSDNPLKESGLTPRTFRLPTQPRLLPRELGPRTLELVPPTELAHHLAELSAGDGARSEEELFRAVLDLLGLKRLTDNAKSVLRSALALVAADNRGVND
jgi:hypothetical protein